MKTGYIPQADRKKILFLADDFRLPSGVGTMSKEIILGTAHRFNWVQIGGAIKHPEFGKILDASTSVNDEIGITDSYVRVLPYNGYGDANVVRQMMISEKPDAILHFTDPRYWIWLYHMEHEIREHIPIMFYTVWDDLPYPKYNEGYYRSCDSIFTISKQTHNIVRNVWQTPPLPKPWQLQHIPHGVDPNVFHKLTTPKELERMALTKKALFGDDEVDYVVMYNSRNIRRKSTSDVIIAYRDFVDKLPPKKAAKCRLLLHTQPIDENGTDLIAVLRDVAPHIKVVFSANRVDPSELNVLYNIADVVINLASAEGFGLGTLEALMAETMILANVTGGLQDQMGFTDENGNVLHEDVHYTKEWGSNHDGKYTKHGVWALPVFPKALSLVGSPQTPYIFDDRCDYRDATKQLIASYYLPKDERDRRGALGREFAHKMGFTNEMMCQRFIDGIESTLSNWKPRKRFQLTKV